MSGRSVQSPAMQMSKKERAACGAVGPLVVPVAETAADDRPAAHTDAEAEGLNDGHERKDDADSR